MEVIKKLREAGMISAATVFVDTLAQLAAFGQQLDEQSPHRRRWLARCTTALVIVEEGSESDVRQRAIAEHALVGWALACITVDGPGWQQGALFVQGRELLGAHPPLDSASAVVEHVVDLKEWLTETWRWDVTDTERPVLVERARELLAVVGVPRVVRPQVLALSRGGLSG